MNCKAWTLVATLLAAIETGCLKIEPDPKGSAGSKGEAAPPSVTPQAASVPQGTPLPSSESIQQLEAALDGPTPDLAGLKSKLEHLLQPRPDSEKELRGRIARLAWRLDVRQLPDNDDGLELADDLLKDVPSGIAPEEVATLRTRLDAIKGKVAERRRDELLSEADKLLAEYAKHKDEARAKERAGLPDPSTLWQSLEPFLEDKRVAEVRQRLRWQALYRAWDEFEAAIARAKTEADASVRASLLAGVQQEVLALIAQHDLPGDWPKYLRQQLRVVEQSIVSQQQEAERSLRARRKKYNAWALAKIELVDGWLIADDGTVLGRAWVNTQYNEANAGKSHKLGNLLRMSPSAIAFCNFPPDLRGRIEANATREGDWTTVYNAKHPDWGWNPWLDEIAMLATRDLLQQLAAIDTSLLEPPVHALYQKAFEKGWSVLGEFTSNYKGSRKGGFQLDVAKHAATADKKPLWHKDFD